MHRGLSRALKMPQWGIFSDRDVPLAYGLAVTAAGGGRLHSKLFSSPMVHKRQFPQKHTIKKYLAASCEVFCGAPSGTRTQDPLIKSQLLYQLS